MSKATYPPKLPASIKAAAAKLAKEDGVSLSQWIAAAMAEKVGAVETAADFFKRRAGKAKPTDLLWFLDRAPTLRPLMTTGSGRWAHGSGVRMAE